MIWFNQTEDILYFLIFSLFLSQNSVKIPNEGRCEKEKGKGALQRWLKDFMSHCAPPFIIFNSQSRAEMYSNVQYIPILGGFVIAIYIAY